MIPAALPPELFDATTGESSFRYPNRPGVKSSIETTVQAAVEMADSAPVLRARCLAWLKRHKSTADEVATALSESILSIRPRISELRRKGLIRDTGERRLNQSGKRAAVWQAI